MTGRRALAVGLVLAPLLVAALGRPVPAEAREAAILVLTSSSAAPYSRVLDGFREELAAGGAEPTIEVHDLSKKSGDAKHLLREAAARGVPLVLTLGAQATDAALATPNSPPIVAGMVLRTESLRSSGRATGVGLQFAVDTQLAWMRRIVPSARTIGVLYDPATNRDLVDDAHRAALGLGVRLEAIAVRTPEEIPGALGRLARGVDVFWGIPDDMVFAPQTAREMLLFSFRHRIPLVGISSYWVKAGALYSLERDYRDIGRQCGELARRVLAGVPPGALPPVSPRKILLTINRGTAERLGIEFAREVVATAAESY